VNKEAFHYVKLFSGNKIGNLIFSLPLVRIDLSHQFVVVVTKYTATCGK
jgi:hypothetical protein